MGWLSAVNASCACILRAASWHAAYGMPADLEYQAEGGGLEPASTCRVLHALLKQRQRDIDRGKEATERLSRMAHDLRMRDQQREKMLQKLAAKDRELGALENKVSSHNMP